MLLSFYFVLIVLPRKLRYRFVIVLFSSYRFSTENHQTEHGHFKTKLNSTGLVYSPTSAWPHGTAGNNMLPALQAQATPEPGVPPFNPQCVIINAPSTWTASAKHQNRTEKTPELAMDTNDWGKQVVQVRSKAASSAPSHTKPCYKVG